MPFRSSFFTLLVILSASLPLHAQTNSQLWGKNGELWDPKGRLPDFSFAGYRSGEAPIPNVKIKSNVKNFGAKGDGITDDTAAFKKAIAETKEGAILIPAGRYVITDILYIEKPRLVLQGEGPDKSILFFPKPLEEIKPNRSKTTTGRPTSNYSWSGGLIWVRGEQKGAVLGSVKSKALRGSHSIEVDRPVQISQGQRVEIYIEDPGDGSLLNYLYDNNPGSVSQIKQTRNYFVSKVVGSSRNLLTLERGLRTDIDPHWLTKVKLYEPSVTEVGIENLGFEFPNLPYRGHFTEEGFNPLAFAGGVADCWARNLRIKNADSGPYLGGSSFVTLDGLVIESERAATKPGDTGHHGVTMGTDNLLENFDIRCKFIHDITVEMSCGSVVSHGKGVDLSFDHHKRFPFANLFTDLDLGIGSRMYLSGGGDNLGRHSAAWTTFWNVRSEKPQHWPPNGWGPDLMTFVGITSKDNATLDPDGQWFEPVAPSEISPQNLYKAQLTNRLKSLAKKP